MPIALDSPTRKPSGGSFASSRQCQSKPGTRDAAHRLTKLLTSAPIDLSGISDEIRRHPDLESLILRPAVSIVPSIDEPLSTIEEAVVVLGTSRLRTLIDAWSSTNPVDIEVFHTDQAQR